jgi:chromosome partitioning protein
MCADFILVPVRPEYLSTIGLPLLARSLKDFKARYDKHNIEIAGIVFNATSEYAPEEAISTAEVRKVAQQEGWYVFQEAVRYSRSYPKSAREGRPIRGTTYSRTTRVQEFDAFATEFASVIGL